MRVDLRLCCQHPQEQLLLGHLQAEDADRHVGLHAKMLGDVQHERGLAHGRPPGDDGQIRGLEPRRQGVDVDKPARHTGDQPLVLLQLFDGREAALHEVAQRHEPGVDVVIGDGEDLLLRLIQDQVGRVLCAVGRFEDPVGGEDQVAEGRLLLDDPRVVPYVSRAGNPIHEPGDVGRPADAVEVPRPPELILQGDQVYRLTPFVEIDHLVKNAPVRVPKEVVSVNQLRRLVERVVVDQDRAEDTALCFKVVRQRPLGGGKRDRLGHDSSCGADRK